MDTRIRSDIRLLENPVQSPVASHKKILKLNSVRVESNLSFELTLLAVPREAVSHVLRAYTFNRSELASPAESLRELL
jgi:hypothetical protein